MDNAQLIATVMASGGGGAIILAIVNFAIKQASGAAGRERVRNTDLVMQRVKAVEERDAANRRANEADRARREALDEAAHYRRQLIAAGLEPVEFKPPAPRAKPRRTE